MWLSSGGSDVADSGAADAVSCADSGGTGRATWWPLHQSVHVVGEKVGFNLSTGQRHQALFFKSHKWFGAHVSFQNRFRCKLLVIDESISFFCCFCFSFQLSIRCFCSMQHILYSKIGCGDWEQFQFWKYPQNSALLCLLKPFFLFIVNTKNPPIYTGICFHCKYGV